MFGGGGGGGGGGSSGLVAGGPGDMAPAMLPLHVHSFGSSSPLMVHGHGQLHEGDDEDRELIPMSSTPPH